MEMPNRTQQDSQQLIYTDKEHSSPALALNLQIVRFKPNLACMGYELDGQVRQRQPQPQTTTSTAGRVVGDQ